MCSLGSTQSRLEVWVTSLETCNCSMMNNNRSITKYTLVFEPQIASYLNWDLNFPDVEVTADTCKFVVEVLSLRP